MPKMEICVFFYIIHVPHIIHRNQFRDIYKNKIVKQKNKEIENQSFSLDGCRVAIFFLSFSYIVYTYTYHKNTTIHKLKHNCCDQKNISQSNKV